MNKKYFKSKNYCWSAIIVGLLFIASCKKYDYLGFTPGTGAPSISSVHTYLKADTTAEYDTLPYYDADGNLRDTLRLRQTRVNPFDSATVSGNLGSYYVINGTNLGSATSVTFNGYDAYFNRALVTDNSIIVQVPSKTPYLAPLATDSLVVTTLYGKAYYAFKILPPPPTAESYSNYDFYAGSQITLSGVGFASVTNITLTSTGVTNGTANVTIVNQNDNELVLQFPTTTIERGALTFAYTIDGTPGILTDKQELIDLDNAYQIFTDDFQNSWSNGSWSGQAERSTDVFKTGNASFKGVFPKGGWKIEGFQNWNPSLPYDASYKFLVFWVKGGTAEETVTIQTNTSSRGYGQNQDFNPVTVPATDWKYFKIPLSSIDFWSPDKTLQQLGFFIKGPDDADQLLYFDDVVLVK